VPLNQPPTTGRSHRRAMLCGLSSPSKGLRTPPPLGSCRSREEVRTESSPTCQWRGSKAQGWCAGEDEGGGGRRSCLPRCLSHPTQPTKGRKKVSTVLNGQRPEGTTPAGGGGARAMRVRTREAGDRSARATGSPAKEAARVPSPRGPEGKGRLPAAGPEQPPVGGGEPRGVKSQRVCRGSRGCHGQGFRHGRSIERRSVANCEHAARATGARTGQAMGMGNPHP